jgi:O-antigen/teichoic acid export membrane protein
MTVRKGLQAALWSSVEIGLRQCAQFAITIVLARLLLPEDFGVAAMLVFMASFAIAIMQNGISLALVTTRETNHAQETTIFWINMAIATAGGLILIAVAPVVASFYGQPALRLLILAVVAQIFFFALGSVHTALLTRSLHFRQLTVAGVTSTIAGGLAAIAAALAGAGVWALATQYVVGAAVNTLLLWLLSPWRPRRAIGVRETLPLIRSGSLMSLSGILEVLYSQGFVLLIGKFYGMRDVGLYSRAQSTQFFPSSIISMVIARIAIPLFAAKVGDPEALRRGLRLAIRMVMIINLPVMAGVAVLAGPLIHTLFGAQWDEAAPITTILALAGALLPLHVLNLQLLLAQGEARTFLNIEVKKKSVGVILVLAGGYFGIYGVAWSQIAFSVLVLPLNTQPTARTIGYGVFAQLRDLADIVLATAVMIVALILLGQVLVLPAPLFLAVAVPAGAFVYGLCGFALQLPSFVALYAGVRQGLFRAKAGAADGPVAEPPCE